MALIIAFAFWLIIAGFVGVYASFFNSGQLLTVHAFWFTLSVVVGILAKIVFASIFGLPGVAWAATAATGLLYVIPM